MAKRFDCLRLIVFEDRKGGLVEIRNQPLFIVEYSRVERDFLHFRAKDEGSAFIRRLLVLSAGGAGVLPGSCGSRGGSRRLLLCSA